LNCLTLWVMKLYENDGKWCVRHQKLTRSGNLRTRIEEFDSQEERENWLDVYDEQGGQLSISQHQIAEFIQLKRIAKDSGRSLSQLVKGGVKAQYMIPIYWDEAVELFVMAKDEQGCRGNTLMAYNGLKKLSMPTDVPVSEFTSHDIKLARPKRMSNYSWNLILVRLGTLFTFLQMNNWANHNPAKEIPRTLHDKKEVEVFTPDQLRQMIQWGFDKVNTPFVHRVITYAYTGMRTSEYENYTLSDNESHIRINARSSKTRLARFIPICPELKEWWIRLGAVRIERQTQYEQDRRAMHKSTGIKRIPNGLRHSYASYRLDECQSEYKVARILGHSSTQTLYEHYRALVEPGHGKLWFNVGPEEFGL